MICKLSGCSGRKSHSTFRVTQQALAKATMTVAGLCGSHTLVGLQATFAIQALAGWWFGKFFIFHNIWDNPSH
jgi:Na+/H+ antiporter NhaB